MGAFKSPEQQYLEFLGLFHKEPSLSFLSELVKTHLALVPYENISKLIRFKNSGPNIPSFEEYVEQILKNGMGGTCFAQNIHLNQLLKFLGFDSRLVSICRGGLISHVSLRVKIDQENYFVDVGIMSPVAGPYLIRPEAKFERWVGDQRIVYEPAGDLENYKLEIHRDGKLIRSFEGSSANFSEDELHVGIRKTFESGAMFMTTLCVHRAFESHSIGIWNRQLYRIDGTRVTKREIKSFEELQAVFMEDLHLVDFPLKDALKLLGENGAQPLY